MSRQSLRQGGRGRTVLFGLMLLGAAARVIPYLGHPTDHRTLAPWRESDYTQIARSFYREDANILYPRIDWREDTPGFVEMELPLLPWLGAALYRLFGYHEQILRLLAATAGIAALIVFARLADRILPPSAALFATAALTLNGLHLHLSSSIQPEALQILLTILAVGSLQRWTESQRPARLFVAAAFAAGAILTKSPSAYLGILFGYVVLRHRGTRALTERWTWAAASTAVVPPLAWLLWAHQHYGETGLSLGLSNETHFLNWEVLRHPKAMVIGNVRAEALEVFGIAGLTLAACALLLPWKKIELATVWYLAVGFFYLMAADTSGDAWASYYHANSIAPACLLMGSGLAALVGGKHRWQPRVAYLLAGLTVLGLLGRGAVLTARRHDQPELEQLYRCSRELAAHVPVDGKIVVRGGAGRDWHGHPVAYHQPMAFTWMDRKGFVIAREELRIETLDRVARRGGRYWLARSGDLADITEGELQRRFRRLASCDGYTLYDLEQTKTTTAPEPLAKPPSATKAASGW